MLAHTMNTRSVRFFLATIIVVVSLVIIFPVYVFPSGAGAFSSGRGMPEIAGHLVGLEKLQPLKGITQDGKPVLIDGIYVLHWGFGKATFMPQGVDKVYTAPTLMAAALALGFVYYFPFRRGTISN